MTLHAHPRASTRRCLAFALHVTLVSSANPSPLVLFNCPFLVITPPPWVTGHVDASISSFAGRVETQLLPVVQSLAHTASPTKAPSPLHFGAPVESGANPTADAQQGAPVTVDASDGGSAVGGRIPLRGGAPKRARGRARGEQRAGDGDGRESREAGEEAGEEEGEVGEEEEEAVPMPAVQYESSPDRAQGPWAGGQRGTLDGHHAIVMVSSRDSGGQPIEHFLFAAVA